MSSQHRNKARRDWLRENDPAALQRLYRRQNLQKYRITPEQYDELLEKQGGLCAICQVHHSKFQRRLAVDHCHHTGKIRGLLCASCNSGIGKLQDDVEILKAALAYLGGSE